MPPSPPETPCCPDVGGKLEQHPPDTATEGLPHFLTNHPPYPLLGQFPQNGLPSISKQQEQKSPLKHVAKPNPNKESQKHAKKASPDNRFEDVGAEITSNNDIDHITLVEDKKCKSKDCTTC